MKKPFPPELRTTARVSRWNILWSSMHDNVAQHSFFVAWYALMTAQLIKWQGPTDALLVAALSHDLDETVTADITGPIKSQILKDNAQEYIDARMSERMGDLIGLAWWYEENNDSEDIYKIVAFADLLDAVLWLQVNRRMGNTAAHGPFFVLMKKLEAAWRALPAPKDELDLLWQTTVYPSVNDHMVEGGCGI